MDITRINHLLERYRKEKDKGKETDHELEKSDESLAINESISQRIARLRLQIAGTTVETKTGNREEDGSSETPRNLPGNDSTGTENSDSDRIDPSSEYDGDIQESDEGIREENNTTTESNNLNETTDKYGNLITYNSKQQEFITLASSGKSCVLIGAAGTGKTTCQKGSVRELILNERVGILSAEGHKYLESGTPGIVICSYTRRAVNNIRNNVSEDIKKNCITIHKLLEYQPVYEETINELGETRTKMSFQPNRHPGNPLPPTIKTIIFEESSMLGIDLYKEVIDACPHNPQLIFIGDIQQLPPVFGPAILGFKLTELPVVELTEVYRQALESPIIRLAHRILSAKPIPASEFPEWNIKEKLTIKPWKKKIKDLDGLNTIALMFCGNKHTEKKKEKQVGGLEESGYYDPEEDIILIPFNKAFGTDELNKKIANYLARKNGRKTFQVISGFNKHYFSIGDKVLFDKEDATIKNIQYNPTYSGAKPLGSSETLDYWGFDPIANSPDGTELSDDATDFILAQMAGNSTGEKEERVKAASHIITLSMNDSDVEYKVQTAGDINKLSLGYVLTIHKAQGSEWRKVFCIFHQSHATMLQRELLYTAITRAREELFIVCEPETFVNGILSQRVKGDTLEEKAEFFKGRKAELGDRVR